MRTRIRAALRFAFPSGRPVLSIWRASWASVPTGRSGDWDLFVDEIRLGEVVATKQLEGIEKSPADGPWHLAAGGRKEWELLMDEDHSVWGFAVHVARRSPGPGLEQIVRELLASPVPDAKRDALEELLAVLGRKRRGESP